jgi:hypothetical protein
VTVAVLGGIFSLKGSKNLKAQWAAFCLSNPHSLPLPRHISLVGLIILLCCRWLAPPTRTRSHSRISTDEIHLPIWRKLPTKLPHVISFVEICAEDILKGDGLLGLLSSFGRGKRKSTVRRGNFVGKISGSECLGWVVSSLNAGNVRDNVYQ